MAVRATSCTMAVRATSCTMAVRATSTLAPTSASWIDDNDTRSVPRARAHGRDVTLARRDRLDGAPVVAPDRARRALRGRRRRDAAPGAARACPRPLAGPA